VTTADLLYLGDDPALVRELFDADVTVCPAPTPTAARGRPRETGYDCLLCDRSSPGAEALLAETRKRGGPPVVVRGDGDGLRLDGSDGGPSAVRAAVRAVADGGGSATETNGPTAAPASARESGPGRETTGAPATDGGRAARERTDGGSRVPDPDATPGPFDDPVLDSLGDLLFVADLEGNLLRWNSRFEAVTGYSAAGIAELDPLEFFADRDAESIADVFERVEAGEEVTEEVDLVTSDGETIPYEVTVSPVDEEPSVLSGVGREITQRRETEQRLDEAISELERSNAELEQFAYVASHDMKQPLRMVSSYLDLLERRYADELDEDAREFIEFASDGADRMREMIDGLLAYSRVGRRDREHEPVDLRDALDTALTNLEIPIEEEDAEVAVEPLPRVEGDPSQLAQLFQNLVGNAIKYSEGRPRVGITAEDAGDRWAVSVADDGMGIPEERRERVFDIFAHGEEAGGSGIGLAICEKIVDRHGGDIRVESEVGEGSTFTFTFPKLGASGEGADPDERGEAGPGSAGNASGPSGA
jgi:PAS domain S-box-containing protein